MCKLPSHLPDGVFRIGRGELGGPFNVGHNEGWNGKDRAGIVDKEGCGDGESCVMQPLQQPEFIGCDVWILCPIRLAVSAVGLNDYVPDLDYVAISSASHLYVRERRSGRAEFYDLVADPGAQIDLGGQAAGIEFYAAKVPAPLELPSAAAVLGDRAREQLEALGYLGSAGESTARRR